MLFQRNPEHASAEQDLQSLRRLHTGSWLCAGYRSAPILFDWKRRPLSETFGQAQHSRPDESGNLRMVREPAPRPVGLIY